MIFSNTIFVELRFNFFIIILYLSGMGELPKRMCSVVVVAVLLVFVLEVPEIIYEN